MSLLRKIRRRHKDFVAKRSTQIISVHGAASVSSVEDEEDGDEDDDRVGITGQVDAQNLHVFIAPSSINETAAVKDSVDCISPYVIEIANDVNVIETERAFWPWIAKIALLLLISSGAFYIGKVAAVGITTMFLLLACKLSAKDLIHNSESSNYTDFRQSYQSDESIHLRGETEIYAENKLDESPFQSAIAGEDINGAEIDMEINTYDKDEEYFRTKTNGSSLLTKRKQLKRLNCIKLPPSASPFGEATEEPPSSSKASPRTWFRNAGTSMVAGNNTVENSSEFRKQVKGKSKALFRRLRKGEPHSTPSSPLWSDSESINGIAVVSDGSDSERAINGNPAACRKSKFRPVSPVAKETSGADGSMNLLEQQRYKNLGNGNVEKSPTPSLPDSFTMKKEGKQDDLCKAKMMKQQIMSPKEQQSARIPPIIASGEGMPKLELPASVVNTNMNSQEIGCVRRGNHQSEWKPVSAGALQENNDAALADLDVSLSQAGILKRRARKVQEGRAGIAWLTTGLAIITAGLLMGRIVAVAGLVCYWYALSLLKKRTKALKSRR